MMMRMRVMSRKSRGTGETLIMQMQNLSLRNKLWLKCRTKKRMSPRSRTTVEVASGWGKEEGLRSRREEWRDQGLIRRSSPSPRWVGEEWAMMRRTLSS